MAPHEKHMLTDTCSRAVTEALVEQDLEQKWHFKTSRWSPDSLPTGRLPVRALSSSICLQTLKTKRAFAPSPVGYATFTTDALNHTSVLRNRVRAPFTHEAWWSENIRLSAVRLDYSDSGA